MAFPRGVVEEAMVRCRRRCCLCEKFCGIKIETHHIVQKSKGGKDTFDNLIALCFDCHAEVKAYNPKHPKGRNFTASELKRHRDSWYERCAAPLAADSTTPNYVVEDRKVLARIDASIPLEFVRFMKDERYHVHFRFDATSAAELYLRDADYVHEEFLDSELESLRKRFTGSLYKFVDVLTLKARPVGEAGTHVGVPARWKDNKTVEYDKIMKRLDKLAAAAVKDYEELIRTGRRKLGSSIEVPPADPSRADQIVQLISTGTVPVLSVYVRNQTPVPRGVLVELAFTNATGVSAINVKWAADNKSPIHSQAVIHPHATAEPIKYPIRYDELPGRSTLLLWYEGPTGIRFFDTYEIAYPGSGSPASAELQLRELEGVTYKIG